jgi:uroporphyrinogen-III synthase
VIPAVIPPLTGLSVLVTRPAAQAAVLAARIRALGGDAQQLPAIEIRPLTASVSVAHDLVIFVSVNAVEHGSHLILRTGNLRIAAIGRATAAALAAADLAADIVPEHGFTSEALLAHPQLTLTSGARILIVRGHGGRDLLQQTFASQGFAVDVLDVYERVLPTLEAGRRDELESLWSADGVDVVTITSVETLSNLLSLLSERGRDLLRTTPLVVPSPRIKEAAAEMGLYGDCILAAGADDESITGALSQWHARARFRAGTSLRP